MNLGVIESRLLPPLQRAVGRHAAVHAGPPVFGAATGMKFDVWVHAARFEDLGGVTADGAVAARRAVRPRPNLRGIAEERPARIVVEVTCTGPTGGGVQTICGALPPPVLLELETMPHPVLSALPNDTVVLRFADFTATVHSSALTHRATEESAYFVGVVTFQLEGFLHLTLTRRGGLARTPAEAPEPVPAVTLRVVQGPKGADVTGEHVRITNSGTEPLALGGYVLHDGAPRRPHRFVLPALTLPPGASVRVWTGKGRDDAENLYWGRARSVWNNPGDRATLLDPSGARVSQARHPARRRPRSGDDRF